MKNRTSPRLLVAFLAILMIGGLVRVEAQTKSTTLSHLTMSLPSNHHLRNARVYDSYSIRQLTHGAANDVQPTWSPDGNTVAFISDSLGGSDGYDLFAINPDGTAQRALAYFTFTDYWGGRFYDPSWLGNSGDMLVMDFKYFWEVLRFDLSGATAANALPVTRSISDGDSPYMKQILFVPGGEGAMSPIVSADTSRLAWFAHINTGATPQDQQVQQVRVYSGGLTSFIGNTDAAGTVVFQTNPGGFLDDAKSIAFSPDGSKLVVSACMSGWYDSGKRRDLYIVDLKTDDTTRITTTGDQGINNVYVSWSSKNVIAFSSMNPTDSTYDLYTINPDGTGLQRLTNTPSANEIEPSWSPDGSKLAFASDANGNWNIYVMDIGSGQTTVSPFLHFPLANLTPYNGPIVSVFDHSGHRYSPNDTVEDFAGEVATVLDPNEPPAEGNLYSYKKQDGTAFLSSVANYVGTLGTGPTTLNYDGHPGYDYRVPIGTTVYAAASGKVIVAHNVNDDASGKWVRILHGNNYLTQYLHLNDIDVSVGQNVNEGDSIGHSGNTGGVAPHLHFEVKEIVGSDSISVDPYGWQGQGADPYTALMGVVNQNLWLTSSTNQLTWINKTPMPISRSWAPAVQYGGKIYVVGGCSSSQSQQFQNAIANVEVYDPSSDSWTELAAMPTARVSPVAALLNGSIYVIGGFDPSYYWSADPTVEVYNIASNTWSTGTPLPTGCSWASAVALNGKIYVLGGVGSDYFNTMQIFDPSTNAWSSGPSFTGGRYLCAATTYNGKIYLIGGDSWETGSDVVYNDIQVYDPATNTWTSKTPMPSPYSGLSAVALSGKIYVFGGDAMAKIYDINSDSWQDMNSNQDSSGAFSVCVYNNNIYRFGGGGWGPTNSIVQSVDLTATPVRRASSTIPTKFAMLQNYPNPFNPSTTIRYQLPVNGFVTLKVYDVLGREVRQLVNERENAGIHFVTFDATNLPSGVYFYELQAGPYHDTQKLLLLK